MPTTQDVQTIIHKIERRLAVAEGDGVYLKVAGERLDDDWLYVVIVPGRAGVRASDHANLMSKIERELRAGGDEKVLLVPAIED